MIYTSKYVMLLLVHLGKNYLNYNFLKEVIFLQTIALKQKPIFVPSLTPEIVDRLLNFEIKQVFSKGGSVYCIKPIGVEHIDIFNSSILFDIENRSFCKVSGIKVMAIITTYHDSCGNSERFLPSLMEVLSQIPKDLINKTFAFEITQHIISEDEIICEKDRIALTNGYLIGSLTLFSKK